MSQKFLCVKFVNYWSVSIGAIFNVVSLVLSLIYYINSYTLILSYNGKFISIQETLTTKSTIYYNILCNHNHGPHRILLYLIRQSESAPLEPEAEKFIDR